MNKQEMIEKLKDETKTLAFGLLSKEEQCVLERAGKDSCQCYYDSGWGRPVSKSWRPCVTYILKPDYQPEPEYVDIEIVTLEGRLVIKNSDHFPLMPFAYININVAVSLVGFVGFFWMINGNTQKIHTILSVAKRHRGDFEPFARFVKETK